MTLSRPTFAEALRVWTRIGLLSFGGPAGQIALMHRELVEERKWLEEEEFLHALNFCMLLPGPEAMQLATYAGWKLHGTRGGLIAGLLFILPGFLVILALSMAYFLYADTSWLKAAFYGLKAAVLAIVLEALVRIGKRSLKSTRLKITALVAFAALFLLKLPFPVVILGAAVSGWFFTRGTVSDGAMPLVARSRPLKTILIWTGLWAALPAFYAAIFGIGVFSDIAVFFSKMAVVTFGGAYAVLSYVAQQAVSTYGWLSPGEMLDGLGLAETTPGPLILVLCFTGFLGAARAATGLDPLLAGTLGATLTAWVTFVPCFMWIFLGAPYMERLRALPALNGALAAISAAVTGVILNLTLWFAGHSLFVAGAIDWAFLALTVTSVIALIRFHVPMAAVLAVSAAAGFVFS